MVDATLEAVPAHSAPVVATGLPAVRLYHTLDEARAVVGAIEADAVHTGYQHPSFLLSWLEMVGCRPMFAELRAPGSGPVLLPLEICANGIAGYCGDRHQNGSFPVGRRADIEALSAIGPSACIEALRRSGAPASAIILERQHSRWNGLANPFVTAASVPSPNPALSFSLAGGFDAVLAARSGKRKRKKWRNQNRKLEVEGTVAYLHPAPADAVPALLDRFFELKAQRFREAGIADVFADTRTRAFFHLLFQKGMACEPRSHEIHAMTIDGTPAAIIGCTLHGGRMTVDFGTFDERYAHAGPGETLFFSAIRHACEAGHDTFDFGVGDEPYKRAWCDIETRHADTAIGLTARGRLQAFAHVARARVVAKIKADKRLWALAKRIRRLRSGAQPDPATGEERDD